MLWGRGDPWKGQRPGPALQHGKGKAQMALRQQGKASCVGAQGQLSSSNATTARWLQVPCQLHGLSFLSNPEPFSSSLCSPGVSVKYMRAKGGSFVPVPIPEEQCQCRRSK